MKRKINIQMIGISIAAILVTMLLLIGVFYEVFQQQVREDLRGNANMLRSTGVFDRDTSEVVKAGEISIERDDIRVTWIAPDGTVLYDNDTDALNMSNHANRPEVEAAFQTGSGEAVRKSDTFGHDTYYYAQKLADGSVIRVAKDARNSISIFKNVVPILVIIVLVMIIVSIVLAHFLTLNILQPIDKMAADIEEGESDIAYKELEPFAERIRSQHVNILKAAKMRQDFTANVSHELKTPLTAISGYAELIEKGMVDEETAKQFAGKIGKNSNRLLSLINDIIRLSELDNPQQEIVFEDFDLLQMAELCVDNLKMNAARRNVTLSLSGTPATVHANRSMISELITNLCDNAIRYNRVGGWVHVNVSTVDGKAVLEVEDNGIGIPREHQERVFERFYRVDKSRSKQTGGTGLGLAIVRHIVSIHDAKVELKSSVGEGTKIRVIF